MFQDHNSMFSMPISQPGFYMTPTSDDQNSSTINSFFMPRLRSSTIDNILNRPNANLDDLLDEEDFSYDLKNGNPKLLDFFSKNPENIRKLVDYVIVMPPDPNDQKRSHKFPFVACEILEADIAAIMNAFFFTHALKVSENTNDLGMKKKDNSEDYEVILDSKAPKEEATSPQRQKSLLEHLFSFIETDQELNPVLSGYFNKVVQVLLRRNPRRMIEFVYEKEHIMQRMARHIGDKSIAELVAIFINYEPSQTDEKPGSRLKIKKQTLDCIIEILLKSGNEQLGDEESINAGNILNEIIQKHTTIIDGKELIAYISSSGVFQKLLDSLKIAETSKVTSICNVLTGLLQYYTPNSTNLGPLEPSGPEATESTQERDKVIQTIVNNMVIFLKILEGAPIENSGNTVETTFGLKTPMIGSWRLKTIEIVQKLILLDDQDIFEKISELNLLKIISDLFNGSPWNNLLHTVYERLVNIIFDKSDPTLIKALFEKANLLDIIVQAGQQPDYELPKRGRKVRKGYMGHIIRIGNSLVRFGNIEDNIERQLRANSQWSNFVNAVLKKQNETNNTQIGGYNPRNFVSPSMESSFGSLALAESQTMQTPISESFATMPEEIQQIPTEKEPKGSPSKAGDIAESHAFQEWKERKKEVLDPLMETVVPSVFDSLEHIKVHDILQKPYIEPVVITKENHDETENIQTEIKSPEKSSSVQHRIVDGVIEVPTRINEEEAKKSFSPEKVKENIQDKIEERKTQPEIYNSQDLKLDSSKENIQERAADENVSPKKNEDLKQSVEIQETRPSYPEGLRERNPAMDQMRKSMLGPKGAKVKLKVKKGEKTNPLKIFEAIEKYKAQRDSSMSSSGIEYTFSETSYSESSRPSESEGMSVLEEENKEEMILAKLNDENKDSNGTLINKNQTNSPVK